MDTQHATPELLREDRQGTAVLTLNRPQQRNALTLGLMSAMITELADIGSRADIKVVTIRGNGPAFCAGHDLKEMRADRSETAYQRTFETCAQMMKAIVNLPQPVIAQVHGIATAAGCQLVASCDLALAADDSRFATPGVNIGLFCSTPMVALSRNVSRKQAMEMLLTGEMIDAQTAIRFGLINRAVPEGLLESSTQQLADSIAAKSAFTVKVGKKAFYQQLEMGLDAAYEFTSAVMVKNMMSGDAAEGIDAFIEKRQPTWKDC